MEPVNIDFMLGGNVAQEGPKIEKSIDDITAASKKAVDAATLTGMKEKMKASITEQKQLIKEITLDIKNLQDQLSKDPKNKTIAGDLAGSKKALLEEQAALAGMQRKSMELNSQEVSSQGGVIASLGKWMIGLATVGAAIKIFHSIMESTEASSHAFERVTEQATSGVSYFFKTIASGDWSNFTDGIARAIQGAKDYVDALEVIENKKNEQKIKSSSLDIQIGEARADSYSTDPKVVKEALKRIIKLQTQKLTEEAELARQTYELKRKKVADDNNWNEKELQNTISFYTKNRKLIESGEKYNELTSIKAIAPSQGMNPQPGNLLFYKKAQDELRTLTAEAKKEALNLEQAGRVAMSFSKVTFPQRNEIADLLAKSQDATAAININNRRDKQRLVGIEKKEEDDAAATAKKAQDEKNKRIKEQLDFTTEIGKKRISNAFEIEQQLLNAEADGAEKQRKQADLDYRKKLSDIDIQKAEYIKRMNLETGGIDKATGKPTKKFTAVIPEQDQKQFNDLANAALKVRDSKLTEINKKEQKSVDDLLKMAEKYSDERLKIEIEFNDRIAAVAQKGGILRGIELAKEREERISALSTKLIEETDLYKMATGKQLQISKELTAALIAELEKRIEADQTISSEDADKMYAKLHRADYTVQKTDNPFADLIDGVAKYKAAREEQSKTNTQDDIEGFVKLEDAANKAQKATLEAAAGALQGISSILSQVAGELTGLTDAEKKNVDEVINMINGAATLAQGIATGNPVAIIQGSIELLLNLYKLTDVKSQKIEKRIEADKAAVDKLTIAYDKLGIAISKAYSTDKSKLITDQTANLEAQKKAIEDAKAAELQKQIDKNNASSGKGILGWAFYLLTPGTDQKVVDAYNKQLDDINQQIEDNKDAQLEALTGASVMSAIDEFANAYADAFTTGEDAAAKSADIVKNILKQALVEDLKNDLKTPIHELLDMVANGATQAAIDAKKAAIDAIATGNQKAFEDLGLNTTAAKGITGDVKNLTEDTGSALVGQVIAMRLNVAEFTANYKNTAAMMSQQIALQQRIADNTEFCRKLEKLDRMDATMEYWRVNGMKVV